MKEVKHRLFQKRPELINKEYLEREIEFARSEHDWDEVERLYKMLFVFNDEHNPHGNDGNKNHKVKKVNKKGGGQGNNQAA